MADTEPSLVSETNEEVNETSEDQQASSDALKVQKCRKTYENRKSNNEPNSEVPTTSSPNQNTSRYGRARKPKITEDFYNIEDIFGPYERITSVSPKKKSQKLELSPNKNKDSVNLGENDLGSVLSIDIPDSIEVSKVMKIVSNNSEFSPKSPNYSAKSVKTYENKNKRNSVYDCDYLFLNGVKHENFDETSDSSESVAPKTTDNLNNSVRLFSDASFEQKRTKNKSLSLKKNLPNSENSDDLVKTEEISIDEVKLELENSIKNESTTSENSNFSDASPEVKTNSKQLKKLQKELNIGRLKSGRLRSSVTESSENEDDIVEVEVQKKQKKKAVEVITIEDSEENQVSDPNVYSPKVGDLSWSRVGSYPFWPSIVTVEPGTPRHYKNITLGRRLVKCYHVHFFGDNGRRSWVMATHIFPFSRRSDLEVMAQSVSKDTKPKDPKHLSAFIINPNKLKKWETAVTEAESITDFNPATRIKKFFDMVSPKKKGKKRLFSGTKSPKTEMVSKKIKLDKKYQKKKLPKSKELKIKTEDGSFVSLKIKEEPPEYKPQKNKTKKFPKTADDSKSDDSFSEHELPVNIKEEIRDTPSPQLQISSLQRHKRLNLFKGITKDRVCQICGENKNVYKCKGNCFGLYHIECDKKIRQRVLEESQPAVKHEIVSSILDEILQNVFSATDKVSEAGIEPEAKTEEVEVKYIRTLSISDQIDLKMQEVMKNLIGETKYQDSTTDEGSDSEEAEVVLCESKPTRKVIKHVTADGIFDVIEEEEVNVEDYSMFKCAYCSSGVSPPCFICNREFSKSGDEKKHKCMTQQCGKYFHSECLKDWPQTKWNVMSKSKKIENETLSCPYHNCHTCISDNPRGPLSRYMNEKLSKCIRCPTTYHSTNFCIPAGTEILSAYQLICPKHLQGHDDDDQSKPSIDSPRKPTKLGAVDGKLKQPTIDSPRKPTKLGAVDGKLKQPTIDSPRKPTKLGAVDGKLKQPTIDSPRKPSKLGAVDGAKKPGKVMSHVNASWCFICSMGGSLICCETCPSSFHVECLKLVPPEGRYLCEECESGRLPLYDEIVWVKLGAYRWWPAQILFPGDIPPNVASIPHTVGEFVVRFFGSHDHYWVNRGRVFLFQEGDTGHASSKKSAVDGLFVKAIKEATSAHKKFVEERAYRAAEARNGMKPPSYIKIKVNRPVGNVRSTDADTSNTTPCDCDPSWDQPCGPDSDCLNRILLTECNPMVCAAGQRCCNQSFEKRLYAPVAPFKTTGRGWGLKTLAPVKKGSFVIEYVGEVINEKEYRRRMKRKHEQKDENYYFLTIDKDRMIDAGPKGNVARFMNHSCSPNCETQKWTVNGDTRVGLFAIIDIPSGAELTFNYNLECIGEEKKECRCGATNCSGFIGVKAKQDEVVKKRKSVPLKQKKRKSLAVQETKQAELISCFVCGEPDATQSCDREACNKFYHLQCVQLENFQEAKWYCPWHSCNICSKRTTRCCYLCINSYCPIHSEGNIRYDRVKGFVCNVHDIKQEEEESKEETPEDSSKTKEPNKPKKSKKLIRNMEETIEKEEIESISSQIEDLEKTTSTTENAAIKEERTTSTTENAAIKEDKEDVSSEKSNEELQEKKPEADEPEEVKKENKNGLIIKEPAESKSQSEEIEESGASSGEMLQIDIFVSTEDTLQNNNTAIKKRKSRLSLKKDLASNTSETSSEDEKPLVKLKKIKIFEETVKTEEKVEEKIEEKLPKKINLSQTDLESSESSDEDFVLSPKKYKKRSILKKKKTILSLQNETKSKKNQLKNKYNSKVDKKIKLRKLKDKSKKLKLKKPKLSVSSKLRPKPKLQRKIRRSIRNLKQVEEILSDDDIENNLNEAIEDLEAAIEERKRSTENVKKKRNKLQETIEDLQRTIAESGVTKKKTRSSSSVTEERTTKDTPINLKKKKKSLVNNVETNEEIKPKPNEEKKKKISLSLRKSTRGSKTEENSEEDSVNDALKEENLQNEETSTEITVKRKRGRPRNDEKQPVQNKEETETTEEKEETKTEETIAKTRSRSKTVETPPIEEAEQEDKPSLENEETEETIKRKRGRPRKHPIVPSEPADQSETESDSSKPALPVVKRPKGRPRKHKHQPEETKIPTELYKMKLSDVIPKNPYESLVNEVKLTAKVPARHLRVVLRKQSEIDQKIDNKFLKMQNDIERDLPIRKRSKLRYEAQL